MSKSVETPVSDDQAAERAALQASATEGEGAAAPAAGQGAEVAPAEALAVEFAGIAGALLAAVGPMFPSVKAIYSEEVIKAAAASVAAVCVKHGWLQGGLMGEYAEELTALMVCGPLAVATVQAVKVDLARMNRAPDAAAAVEKVGAGDTAAIDSSAPLVMQRG
jgi:hypothetical protein